jgi:hypothetical protein
VWGLVRGNAAGWDSLEVLASLAAGVVVMAPFVAWERRRDAPMLPPRFFRVLAFTSANVANFCLFAWLYGGVFFMAQYLQTALGYGPMSAGLRLLPSTAGSLTGPRAFTDGFAPPWASPPPRHCWGLSPASACLATARPHPPRPAPGPIRPGNPPRTVARRTAHHSGGHLHDHPRPPMSSPPAK